MYAGRSEWRGQRGHHLLAQRARLSSLGVRCPIEAVAHADVELSRPSYFQGQFVKGSLAGSRIEGRVVRTIANQIKSSLIFKHAPDTAAEIVGIVNGYAACFAREIVESFLSFECRIAAIAERLFQLLGVAARQVIRRGKP